MSTRDRIKKLANKRGMSIPDLEVALGFGNSTIVKWDKASPNTEKLKKVAEFFNVSIDYLLGRTEQQDVHNLEGVYFRLAKGAQDLGLDDSDVDAILNLYKQHQDRNK